MKTAGKAGSRLLVFFIAAAVLLTLGSGMLGLLRSGYRTVQLYQLDGEAELVRADAPMKPYVGMMLQNADRVSTFAESYLYLKMDDDKYLLAEPETRFTLVSEGSRSDARTKIRLDEGTIVNHIVVPLLDQASYEITTPNSTMAIRGTSFRVSVWYDETGLSHSRLQVFEGTVETHLVYPDGTLSRESRFFTAGQAVTIWGSSATSDYDLVEDGIDYYALEIPTLEFLHIGVDGLPGYDISREELDAILALKRTRFAVTFRAGGQVFAKQAVLWNHCAQEPTLKPSASGRWDFDFTAPITEDVEVLWSGG